MQITNFYTGKDSAIEYPDLDSIERSSQRLSDLAIKAEELKLEKRLKDKDTFLKMMKTDPVAAIAQKDRIKQALMKEKFNNKWADRYKKANGELSTADLIEMQSEQGVMDSTQNKILADQKRLADAEESISKDHSSYWDKNYFDKIKQEYLTTDKEDYELPSVLLKVNPQDFGIALSKADVTGTPSPYIEELTDGKGNKTGYIQEYDARMSPQEAGQFIPQYALTNDAYMEDIMRKFQSLPESEQMNVVGDYNGDGKVDPTDIKYAYDSKKITDHPIMQWAAKNPYFVRQAMQLKSKGVAKKKDTGSGGKTPKFDYSNITQNNNQNEKFVRKQSAVKETSSGTFNLPDYMDFSTLPQGRKDASMQIGKVLIKDEKGNTKEEDLNMLVSFEVETYSPSADIAIIKLKDSAGGYSSGDTVAVKGSEITSILSREPFGVYRSQPTAQAATGVKTNVKNIFKR